MKPARLFKYVSLLTMLSSLPLSGAIASEPAMVTKVGGKNVNWISGDKASRPKVQSLLSSGDRLSVGKGSFVDIEFLADSCTVRVKAGDSVTIGQTSPCATGQEAVAPEAKTKTESLETAQIIPAAAGAVEVSGKTGSFARANLGAGMIDISVGDSLNVGDEVFSGPNSSVSQYFPVPGCSYTVTSGNMYKVPAQAPCKAASAAGSVAVPASSDEDDDKIPTGVIVGAVAGVAVIGGVALLALSEDDDDGKKNPATPD